MPSLGEQLRQFARWSPYIEAVTGILSASTTDQRVKAVYALLKLVAAETSTEVDDDLLVRIEAVMTSPEGKELVAYSCRLVQSLLDSEPEA